ncbi:MAG: alanine--tRNA ligase [Alphaproteobacteria bacterium]
MTTANDIRSKFLNYFADNDHEIVSSSPLVPHNDPTLMFTNAGMNQFKNVFTGNETRDYDRAVTTQKCVRAGGKHNDLENVGRTARHHTFFEMLGNFSFGDYFKDVAIEHAWNLITKEYGIDKNRLLVTVFSEDEEAYKLWQKIAGLPTDRIIKIPTSDNFWQMGDTGPCGPCSEIFYDHGDHIWGGPPGSPDEDGDRWVEIWNLVFMQYEQIEPGKRLLLPKPSIDTGMGLERITAVLQGVHDNYDIELFRSLIENSAHFTNSEPYGEHKISHRIIADHLRSTCFLIADGVLPSNEGRGYVLRRIMRRAMRHVYLVGMNEPAIYKMVPNLVNLMGEAFPELKRAQSLITETIKLEEERFQKTLYRGLHLLEDEIKNLDSQKRLDGEIAFKLYDTYGFPLDLTEEALKPHGIEVDVAGFDSAMARQKMEARKNWAGSGETATASIWFELKEKLGSTEFLGYELENAEALILAILNNEQKEVNHYENSIDGENIGYLIVNQTPFYAESGGQVGDIGFIETETGKAEIIDTQKYADGLFVHKFKLLDGKILVNQPTKMWVDKSRRSKIRANHSATHLLHEALRLTLGDHVTQKGSLVTSERLRFDFSHPKALTESELAAVENLVNKAIRRNQEVNTRIMNPEAAQKEGAMALFGEKYGEEVRVVSMGGNAPKKAAWSVELCGGTHVRRTGDIGSFKIISESAVAAGVRRIEAITGQAVVDRLGTQTYILSEIASALNTSTDNLLERIQKVMLERKSMEKEILDLHKKVATGGTSLSSNEVTNINGTKFIGEVYENIPAKELKGMVDEIFANENIDVVVLIAVNEGKASIVVGVNKDKTDQWNAVELVKIGSAALGGKGGGGRPDMAQAGGPDASKANEAIDAVKSTL